MYTDLNPGVSNRAVITYAHLSQDCNLPGRIISIEKGMEPGNDTITERRLVRKRSFSLYISHVRRLRSELESKFLEVRNVPVKDYATICSATASLFAKKQGCRIKFIWWFQALDKVPFRPYCVHQF